MTQTEIEMNVNRKIMVDGLLTEHLCPNCNVMDVMTEEVVEGGHLFTCLNCDNQEFVANDEIHWVESPVPPLRSFLGLDPDFL